MSVPTQVAQVAARALASSEPSIVHSISATLERVGPILVFLTAVTVLAELADVAGVFGVAAREASRWARGRVLVLFLLLVVLASITTILLSLDTTAVLLTPVVLVMCEQLGLAVLPFAMATVWLANTASLLLPVSNLTNLLAMRTLGFGTLTYAEHIWPSALAAIVVTALVLLALHWRSLRGRYELPPKPAIESRGFFVIAGLACLTFAVLVLAEVNVPLASVIAALIAIVGALLFKRDALHWALVPWRLLLFVTALFVVVAIAMNVFAVTVSHGTANTGVGGLAALTFGSAAGANIINNLPAYLAVEPHAAASVTRMFALLIGVNTGPLILLWGSLATLLWRERCRARGLVVSAKQFALHGAVLVPLVMAAALLVLPR